MKLYIWGVFILTDGKWKFWCDYGSRESAREEAKMLRSDGEEVKVIKLVEE